MIKKTRIIPHEVVESLEWMFLDGFDAKTVFSWTVSKNSLSERHFRIFGKNLFTVEERRKEKISSSF